MLHPILACMAYRTVGHYVQDKLELKKKKKVVDDHLIFISQTIALNKIKPTPKNMHVE